MLQSLDFLKNNFFYSYLWTLISSQLCCEQDDKIDDWRWWLPLTLSKIHTLKQYSFLIFKLNNIRTDSDMLNQSLFRHMKRYFRMKNDQFICPVVHTLQLPILTDKNNNHFWLNWPSWAAKPYISFITIVRIAVFLYF